MTKKAEPKKVKKLVVKRQTIRDLETARLDAEKVRGGGWSRSNTSGVNT